MGFSNADIRGSHTIRIFGTNQAGEVLPDIWLDIERIDVFRVTAQLDGHFQGVYRRLYWLDDPASDDYNENGNPARTEGLKKICSPDEEDQENPAQWVPVRTIVEMSWNESSDHDRWSARRGNRTSADNMVRIVAARRCFHRDTVIDDDAEAAADAGAPAYVVASDQYDFIEATDDKDDFIEVQYVSSTMEMSSAKEDEGKNQGVQVNWKNIHYLNFTDPAEGPVNPAHGFDPPWSLDPFQAIVNCQFIPVPQIVIGMPTFFGSPTKTMSTKDGFDFDVSLFGSDSFTGASGLGKTVIGRDYNLIAFGKPRDGPACFLATSGYWGLGTDTRIRRGVIDPSSGDLVWSNVAAFASKDNTGAFCCCFAGEAFFIQYLAAGGSEVHMLVSFDGTTFRFANPFAGVGGAAGSGPPDPIGGSVAYDKEAGRYVTTGSFLRTYEADYELFGFPHDTEAADQNFMSAISSNGTAWTPKFDLSQGWGINNFPTNPKFDIGNASGAASTICYSDALQLFVATSSYKLMNQNVDNAPSNDQNFPIYVPAAAVAVSRDGVAWTNQPIGPASSRTYGHGDQYSLSYCVTFVKTGAVDQITGSDGYFLLGVNGGTNGNLPPERLSNEIWRSEDGIKWIRTRNSDSGFPLAMTQISKNAKLDKVVFL